MTANVVREIGEKVVVSNYEAHVREDREDYYVLFVGEEEVAGASLCARGTWLVSLCNVDDSNGFYVTNKSEAVDALEDIALLHLAFKKVEQ